MKQKKKAENEKPTDVNDNDNVQISKFFALEKRFHYFTMYSH